MATLVARQRFSLLVAESQSAAELPVGSDRTRTYDVASRKKLSAAADADAPGAQAIATRYTGNTSLDLTSFTGTLEAGQDATGQKVNAILLVNNSTVNDVTITGGIGNEYELNGGVSKVVGPGCIYQEFFNEDLADVDGTHKAIDFAVTAGQTFDLILVMG